MRSHYDVLVVKKSASVEEIKKAYQTLIFRLHPDKNSSGNAEEFIAVTEAYKILSDPIERRKYDQFLAQLLYEIWYPVTIAG